MTVKIFYLTTNLTNDRFSILNCIKLIVIKLLNASSILTVLSRYLKPLTIFINIWSQYEYNMLVDVECRFVEINWTNVYL